MRSIFAVILSFTPFVIAGCMAFGGDPGGSAGVIRLSWETLVTIYGPMAGMLLWFMYREKARDTKEAKREEREDADAQKLYELLERSIETAAEMKSVAAQLCIEVEKTRLASYQVRDEMRGNTRIMTRDNQK